MEEEKFIYLAKSRNLLVLEFKFKFWYFTK